MTRYDERINKALEVFIYSVDRSELVDSAKDLQSLLEQRDLSSKNYENCESLFMRLTCKILLSKYLDGFSSETVKRLVEYVEQNIEPAKSKGYNKSAAAMQNCVALAQCAEEYFSAAQELAALAKAAADGFLGIISAADELFERASKREWASPFDGAKFVDVGAAILNRLAAKKSGIIGDCVLAIERIVPFKKVDCADYTYFPLPDRDEGGKANAVVLDTPFVAEARLYAANAAAADVYEIDATTFGVNATACACAFALAEYKKCAMLVVGAEALSDGLRKEVYIRAMQCGKRGITVFLLDASGGVLYGQALKTAIETDGLSVLDISETYITMPMFQEVWQILVDSKMVAESDRAAVKEMPFIGFVGLNQVLSHEHLTDFLKFGKRISDGNKAVAMQYIKHIKSPMLFIDDGWGDFPCDKPPQENKVEFDYDQIRVVNAADIRKIIESGANVFAICGAIARYCTAGTGDYTEWQKLTREQMEERIRVATQTVFKVLRVPIVPQVEVRDELDNETAGGLCCDGGKSVLYKYECCKSVDWMRDAIVHESFHALQSKLGGGDYSQWYYDNMGITYGRVCEWQNTLKVDYDHNTRSKVYKVHMYEADARAFELDCRRACEAAWNEMDFE